MADATWNAGGPPPKGDWLLAFRDAIPESWRFWILLSFAILFQFSGGIQLSLASQLVGTGDLIHQDVMMAGYSVFIGMTMIFPLLFPLKFRFPVSRILLVCTTCLAILGLVPLATRSMFVLIPIGFATGSLRMLGTFTCCSTIQLRITPERNMAKFFPVLWTIILGGIQLSGIVAAAMNHRFGWGSINLVVSALLLCAALVCIVGMTPHRPPFHGPREIRFDLPGYILWSVFLLATAWTLTYGGQLGWFASPRIRGAASCASLSLVLSLWSVGRTDRPHFLPKVLRYPRIPWILALHTAMVLLTSSSFVLQETFTGGILHLGHLDSQLLNRVVFVGVAFGAVAGYVLLEKANLGYRAVTTISFLLILGYLVGMFRLVSPSTAMADLYAPLFLRGAGNAMMYVALFTYTARTVPFFHLFQVIGFYGFVNMGFGGALGSAVMGRLFQHALHADAAFLSGALDRANLAAVSMPPEALAAEFHRQVLLASLRHTYGWTASMCVVVVLLALATRYRNFPRFKLPSW